MKQKGFTLFEVLLTILILTSALITLLQVFSTGLVAGGDNESILVGTALAQEKMEDIRNKSYASVVAETKAAVSGFPEFQREVLITTPQTNLKQVTVNVTWTIKAQELTTQLVTYVSNL